MGFSLLAGLPPVYGLYTSVFPGWLYYVFGTSRHISVGTMALTALMVGGVVSRESTNKATSSSTSPFKNESVFSDWLVTTPETVGALEDTLSSRPYASDVTLSILQNYQSDDVALKARDKIIS